MATEVAIQRNAVLSVATFAAAFSGKIMGTFRTHVAHYYAVFGYASYPSVKCGNKLLPHSALTVLCMVINYYHRADATSIKKPAPVYGAVFAATKRRLHVAALKNGN